LLPAPLKILSVMKSRKPRKHTSTNGSEVLTLRLKSSFWEGWRLPPVRPKAAALPADAPGRSSDLPTPGPGDFPENPDFTPHSCLSPSEAPACLGPSEARHRAPDVGSSCMSFLSSSSLFSFLFSPPRIVIYFNMFQTQKCVNPHLKVSKSPSKGV